MEESPDGKLLFIFHPHTMQPETSFPKKSDKEYNVPGEGKIF